MVNLTLGVLDPRSLKYLSNYLQGLVKGRLWLKVMIGMILGVTVGIVLGPSVGWINPETAATLTNWLAFPGQLFLTLIQMIVIPLVFASVILGLAASENVDQLRSMGLRVVLYFVATTAVAIAIGLWVALLIKPGHFIDPATIKAALGSATVMSPESVAPFNFEELPQRVLSLLPSNPLTSMIEGQMLQVIFFAIIFGVALLMLTPAKARPMLELLASLQEVCMTIVRWAMWLAPFAVFGLLTQLMSRIGIEALLGMGVYVATVLFGLGLLFIMYMILVSVFGKLSPIRFIRATRDVLLLAFSTSSSAAVMPLSIKTAEEKLQVRSSVAQFVIPLGATINMNGTALYQGVATIFLAQVFGVDISIGGMLVIIITAVGASIGSPATPGVGIVILAMVLGSAGVPTAGIALIIGVDRILDMSRTAINVAGDIVACKLMDRWMSRETGRVDKKTGTDKAVATSYDF